MSDDIQLIFPNASADFLARNTGLHKPEVGARSEKGKQDSVRPVVERRATATALGKKKAKAGNRKRFLVRVTSIRPRLLDEDNLCEKFVVDCCRHAGILPDDSPATTHIEARQRKAGEEEQERTLIEIFQYEEEPH